MSKRLLHNCKKFFRFFRPCIWIWCRVIFIFVITFEYFHIHKPKWIEAKRNEKNFNNNNSNEKRTKCILCTHTQAHAHTTLFTRYIAFLLCFFLSGCTSKSNNFPSFRRRFRFILCFCLFFLSDLVSLEGYTHYTLCFHVQCDNSFFVLIIFHIRSQAHTHTRAQPHGQVFTICSMCTIRIYQIYSENFSIVVQILRFLRP